MNVTREFLEELLTMNRNSDPEDPKLKEMVCGALRAFERLPSKYRMVMEARFCDGLVWRDVARVCGLSIDVCKRIYPESLKILEKRFEEIYRLRDLLISANIAHTFTYSASECTIECGDAFVTQANDCGSLDASGILTSEERKKDTVLYEVNALEVFGRIKKSV